MTLRFTFIALLVVSCSKQAPDGDQAATEKSPHSGHGSDSDAQAAQPEGSMSAEKKFGSFAVTVPDGWESQALSSNMRVAHWTMKDAELIVYHFGTGAGTVEQNLERWYGQFEQEGGAPSADLAKVEKSVVSDLAVTSVDLSGHYVAAIRPGAPQKHDLPGHRMLAAVVEAPDGNYFFKMLGPEAAVEAQKAAFGALIASIKKL